MQLLPPILRRSCLPFRAARSSSTFEPREVRLNSADRDTKRAEIGGSLVERTIRGD